MEYSERKTDRRVIKTKRAIRNAFAKLLSKKDINEITIKDIADVADINRKTVYNYYGGFYQIIEEIENEIITSLNDLITGLDFAKVMKEPYILFEALKKLVGEDIEFYGPLLKMNGNANLVAKIIGTLKAKIKEVFASQMKIDGETLDITVDYVVSGMISVFQTWFNMNNPYSIEKVSDVVGVLVFNGVNGLVEGHKTNKD